MCLTTVPDLDSVMGLDELEAHYGPLKGRITLGGDGFIIRLPDQQRIHFYTYDVNRPTGSKLYTFTSEGYYDEHSSLWNGEYVV
jgi:hypothetical protein